MSYQGGNMGLAEGVGIVFIMTVLGIFLSTPTQIVDAAGGAAWIAVLFSGLIPLMLFFVLLFVIRGHQGDLYEITEHLLGKAGANLICLLLIGLYLFETTALLRQFAENTLLTALPVADFSFISLVYGVMAGIVAWFGMEALARTSYVFMPFFIISILLVLVALIPFYNLYNLSPWMGNGLSRIISTSLKSGGTNVSILLPIVFASSFRNIRTLKGTALFGLGLSIIIKTALVLVYCLVFDFAVGREKTLPFFEMTRLVYLGRYVQHIESLFIVFWGITGMLSTGISLYVMAYLTTRLFGMPSIRPLIPILALTATQLSMMPKDVASVGRIAYMAVSFYFNTVLYLIPIILLIASRMKRKKGGKQPCTSGS